MMTAYGYAEALRGLLKAICYGGPQRRVFKWL